MIIIVPLIALVIVIVLLLFGVGGIQFIMSGDKVSMASELARMKKQGIFKPELFGEKKKKTATVEPLYKFMEPEPVVPVVEPEKPKGKPHIEYPIKRGTAVECFEIEESEVKAAIKDGYKVVYR
jgi:hypothetical protein